MTLHELTFDSPIGTIDLLAADDALVAAHLPGLRPPERGARPGSLPVLQRAREQLEAYFAGDLRAFDLPLAPRGTEFQRAVWRALAEIPFGATRSYADIAAAIGRPGASRAVGAANGRNPLAIIVPCHRVVGADGSLTGYAGGLACKEWLLRHERRSLARRHEGDVTRTPPAQLRLMLEA
jgi:methylated-DNA-[protein]-cysteine S-methyltransferase